MDSHFINRCVDDPTAAFEIDAHFSNSAFVAKFLWQFAIKRFPMANELLRMAPAAASRHLNCPSRCKFYEPLVDDSTPVSRIDTHVSNSVIAAS